MKKILLILMALVLSVGSAYAIIDSYTISRDKLPDEARQMLEQYFPKAKVSLIKIDRHLLKKTDYDVRLTNGTTVEFANNGKWKTVDCGKKAVPEALIPKKIRTYVDKNYSGVKIVSIRKKSSGYEIGLSDQVTLTFNLLYQFKSVSMQNE